MAEVAQVKEELLAEFDGLGQDGQALENFATVGSLLSKPDIVVPALKSLAARMMTLAMSRLDVAIEESEMLKRAGPGLQPKHTGARKKYDAERVGADPFRGLLKEVLKAYEVDCMYQSHKQDSSFHPTYLVGLLTPDKFLDQVGDGVQWKDVGATPDHGEFSHRLQWYVVAESGLFSKNAVGSVYRAIGACRTLAKKADRLNQWTLWSRLCDRGPGASSGGVNVVEGNNDCRSPENISLLIRNGDFGLLSLAIKARFNKRAVEDPDRAPTPTAMKNYTAQKAFGKSYQQLEGENRLKVDAIVSTGVLAL